MDQLTTMGTNVIGSNPTSSDPTTDVMTSHVDGLTTPDHVSLLPMDNVTAYDMNETTGVIDMSDFYFYQTEELVFLSTLLVTIVIGNSIVLLAIALSGRRHSRMHFFILNLAIADLFVGLITVLTDIVWKITINFYAGDAMCKMVKFSQAFVMFASTYMLVALSIDRYDAIARPLNFSNTWVRCKVLVSIAWGLSALFASPMLFIASVPDGQLQCWIQFPESYHWQIYVVAVALSVLVIPALIIAACYMLIIRIIWKNSYLLAPAKVKHSYTADKSFRSSNTTNGFTAKGSPKPNRVRTKDMGRSSKGIIPQAKVRTVKMTFTIVLVFVFCWSPYFVYNLLQVFGKIPITQQMLAVSTFVQSFAPLNSAANPIIYGLFSTRICRYLRRIKVFRVICDVFSCCDDPRRARGVGISGDMTDTEYSRRSPRSQMTTANNVEMCDLILSSTNQKGSSST